MLALVDPLYNRLGFTPRWDESVLLKLNKRSTLFCRPGDSHLETKLRSRFVVNRNEIDTMPMIGCIYAYFLLKGHQLGLLNGKQGM